MAIIYEIAFFRIDNFETFEHFFSAIKKFLKKVAERNNNEVFVLLFLSATFLINSLINE